MDLGSQILQYFISGITNGAIYAVIALGFTVIYNATEVINFAQGEFVMLGAMVMITLSGVNGLPVWLCFILAVSVVTLVGMVLERLAIRPVKSASAISLIIITVGASIFLRGVAMMLWGKDSLGLQPFTGERPIRIAGAALTPQSLWVLGITVLVMVALQFFYKKTITGKAMRACSFSKRGACLVGIGVNRMVLLSFGLSAAMGAAGGIVIAPITMCGYDMGTMLGLKGFCAAVLGGLGSSPGSIAGGFLLGILEAMGAGLISSGFKDAIAFAILLIMLFIRPSGLLGQGETGRV
ncbi:MAG: branched-chain amino acid ABC transporter permease [Deltaproteobacteria bacterium]|nr:branched-chain amino acid ABC transporter permease [Deltaproteobacteria bacterium]MBW2070679.1 branched-chain amino acid ABC transporter permease [Deltaproteobacteria bacterium]